MGSEKFDPRHSGELLKHMDMQNEVLMEAYRSMLHELQKLQVEEEMLMRKLYEVMSVHGVTKQFFINCKETSSIMVNAFKSVLKQQHHDLSKEVVDNMMGRALGMANSATLHLSTSSYVPEKSGLGDRPDEDHPEDE